MSLFSSLYKACFTKSIIDADLLLLNFSIFKYSCTSINFLCKYVYLLRHYYYYSSTFCFIIVILVTLLIIRLPIVLTLIPFVLYPNIYLLNLLIVYNGFVLFYCTCSPFFFTITSKIVQR